MTDTGAPMWLRDLLFDHARAGLIQYDCRCGYQCRVRMLDAGMERAAHADHLADLVWADFRAWMLEHLVVDDWDIDSALEDDLRVQLAHQPNGDRL